MLKKNGCKMLPRLYITLSSIAVFLFLPANPRSVINVETGLPACGVEIITPAAALIFAPFVDLPFYFLTLAYPREQLLSWLLWISLGYIIFTISRTKRWTGRRLIMAFRGIVAVAASFILVLIYSILVPLPLYRLKSHVPNEILINLHSHTFYSHDAIISPESNLNWHLKSGFDAWAITEHDSIGPAPCIQEQIIREKSIPAAVIAGLEINFRRGHFNLLGIEQDLVTSDYNSLEELICEVHGQNGAVIVPHYWAARRSPFSLQDMLEAGVDGFEIAGQASVPVTDDIQNELIDFCRNNGLVMVSGTNWHGWRNFCTTWTGFRADRWQESDAATRTQMVIDALRKRETDRFRVIGYPNSLFIRKNHMFEPLAGTYSYYTSLNIWQRISWIAWIAAGFYISRYLRKRRLFSVLFWSAASILLAAKSISVFSTWQTVSQVNKVLPDVAAGLIVTAAITALLATTGCKRL